MFSRANLPLYVFSIIYILVLGVVTLYETNAAGSDMHRHTAEKQAQNQAALANLKDDIAKVQALNDPAKPNADAQQCIGFAQEALRQAELENRDDAFASHLSLVNSRYWLKIALRHLGKESEILSDWQE